MSIASEWISKLNQHLKSGKGMSIHALVHDGNESVLVSPEDAELLRVKWHIKCDRGIMRVVKNMRVNGVQKCMELSRVVAMRIENRDLLSSEIVDHLDGSRLNNRRENLRICTHSDNMGNRHKCTGISGFIGVHPSRNRFTAKIWYNGRWNRIGTFQTAQDAADAYDRAASLIPGRLTRNSKLKR